MTGIASESDPVDWEPLLALLPRLTDVKLERSSWSLASGLEGWLFSDAVLSELIEVLYSSGVVTDFDWTTWKCESPFATTDPRIVRAAELADLRRLLTMHARQDRFAEGHLGEMVEEGHIPVILHRVADLLSQPST